MRKTIQNAAALPFAMMMMAGFARYAIELDGGAILDSGCRPRR